MRAFEFLRRRRASSGDWSAEMGWRYVAYHDGQGTLALQIEPMVTTSDIVYVADDSVWAASAPQWARQRRVEVLQRLQSVPWNRHLEWRVGRVGFPDPAPVPGSLESTPGGQHLEKERLFHPGSALTPDQARLVWHEAVRRFVAEVHGSVTVFASDLIPESVFATIELPALRANPNVQLDLR